MKDTLNAGVCLKPFLLQQFRDFHNLSPKSVDKIGTSETFISLMADILEKGKKTDSPDNTLPFKRDSLQRLIDAVTFQMNEYLVGELSDFDEDGQDAGVFKLQRKWMNDFGVNHNAAPIASTIKQEPPKTKKIESPFEVDEIIKRASNIYGVDPELVTAVVKAESDFDAGATSSKGAMGLMQLMPETAKELGVKNCYDPVENIMAGTRYLKSLLSRYDGNVELTLAAYNWGMGNIERQPDRLPQETRAYIARVNGFLQKGTS
jgi:hypothetical protein